MNSLRTVVIVCLFSCSQMQGITLPNQVTQKTDPLPPCGSCKLPPAAELQPLIALLPDVSNAIRKIARLIQKTLKNPYDSKDDAKSAIVQNTDEMKIVADTLLDKLSESVQNLDSCPQYQQLFVTLKENLGQFLPGVQQRWQTHLTEVEPKLLLGALSNALVQDDGKFCKLLRDLLFQLMQVFDLDSCNKNAQFYYDLLLPNGPVCTIVMGTLHSYDNKPSTLITDLLGGFVPGLHARSLEVLDKAEQLFCGSLRILVPDADYLEISGGFCTNGRTRYDYDRVLQIIPCDFLFQSRLNEFFGYQCVNDQFI